VQDALRVSLNPTKATLSIGILHEYVIDGRVEMNAIAVRTHVGASSMVLQNVSLAGAWNYLQWMLLAATLFVAVNTANTGSALDLDESKRGQAQSPTPQTVEIVRSLVWR
jgi:hypothetical protein